MSRSPRPVNASATACPGLGDACGVLADVGQHGTVPGRPDRELDVGAAFHMDRLFRVSNGFGPSGVRYFAGIARIDGFDEKVLDVRSPRSSAPRRSNRSGRGRRPAPPGIVAPLTDPSGVTMRARYQRIGALRSRCGSLARIGFPVSVRDPAITHSFDAPRPIPGQRADLARRCFRRPRACRRARAGS